MGRVLREVWRCWSPYLLTLDEEAKVSHLEDLRARLADAGLGPADLVGEAAGDRKLLAKARRKVWTSRWTVAAT